MAIPSLLSHNVTAFAADGGALYKTKCAPCHGADGSGNTPVGKSLKVKALASDEVQKLSDADLTKAIQKGKGKMPAFEGKLSDDELQSVVKQALLRKALVDLLSRDAEIVVIGDFQTVESAPLSSLQPDLLLIDLDSCASTQSLAQSAGLAASPR